MTRSAFFVVCDTSYLLPSFCCCLATAIVNVFKIAASSGICIALALAILRLLLILSLTRETYQNCPCSLSLMFYRAWRSKAAYNTNDVRWCSWTPSPLSVSNPRNLPSFDQIMGTGNPGYWFQSGPPQSWTIMGNIDNWTIIQSILPLDNSIQTKPIWNH